MIPKELKELNQWVCCSKANKIPMKATEPKAASSSDPTTWSSYDTALESVADGNYEYLGFVFNDNHIVGIDIDIGFEDELNIILNEMTYDIITKCHSYTELSKSGRGFHIFVKGDLPFSGKNNRKGLEIYKDSRFFVMTGKTRYYTEIMENQEAIDYVLARYFQEEPRPANTNRIMKQRVYEPIQSTKVVNGKIVISTEYPPIHEGNRNNALLSLGGQFLANGMSRGEIYQELSRINETRVHPPLSERELQNVVKSVEKYRGRN